MENILKIVKSLKDSGLLLEGTKCFDIFNLFISLPTFRVYYTHYQGTAFKSFTFHFY